MPLFDLPLAELQRYSPDVPEPDDFDGFWELTLVDTRESPLDLSVTLTENRLALIDTYDLEFSGFGGARVHAWLHVPHGASGPLPAVVEFTGYASGRGLPFQNTVFAQAGYAHIIMDNRGQGQWAVGDTKDVHAGMGDEMIGGYMTRGILDPATHYYRRLFSDAVRVLEATRSLPMVDADRIVVAGASQGGAIAMAAAALDGDVSGALIDIPFLCHIDRAVTITDRLPYREVSDYLVRYRDRERVALTTLSYFDGVHFASRCPIPSLWSVALMDVTCPPSTVYAAFNAYRGPKEMVVYRFNDHEGGAEHHTWRRLGWLDAHFASGPTRSAATVIGSRLGTLR